MNDFESLYIQLSEVKTRQRLVMLIAAPLVESAVTQFSPVKVSHHAVDASFPVATF